MSSRPARQRRVPRVGWPTPPVEDAQPAIIPARTHAPHPSAPPPPTGADPASTAVCPNHRAGRASPPRSCRARARSASDAPTAHRSRRDRLGCCLDLVGQADLRVAERPFRHLVLPSEVYAGRLPDQPRRVCRPTERRLAAFLAQRSAVAGEGIPMTSWGPQSHPGTNNWERHVRERPFSGSCDGLLLLFAQTCHNVPLVYLSDTDVRRWTRF